MKDSELGATPPRKTGCTWVAGPVSLAWNLPNSGKNMNDAIRWATFVQQAALAGFQEAQNGRDPLILYDSSCSSKSSP
jgi:hypothetical protein